MGKKLTELAGSDDQKLSEAILASAQQIWQAGLGAFAVAEQEGGKLFSRLVRDGINIQNRTRHLADIKVGDMTDSMSRVAESLNRQASGSWDKIEQVFEDRVYRTLNQLGVPTSKDLLTLTQRVDELSAQIAHLAAAKRPASGAAHNGTDRTGAKAGAKKTVTRLAATPARKRTAAKVKAGS